MLHNGQNYELKFIAFVESGLSSVGVIGLETSMLIFLQLFMYVVVEVPKQLKICFCYGFSVYFCVKYFISNFVINSR
jgi:hypothetical protein